MKWPSANSNDRKSVFYTSEDSAKMLTSIKKEGTSVTDNVFSFKMGGDDETTESQNSKSSSSIESNSKANSNGTDMKRYLENFMLFSNLEIESEKKCRDEQLSKIVKALMYFEKKLKKEQEVIQQQLCEKDKVINRQMHTISNMKVKFGVQCDELDDDVSIHETSEYCPMCRKKYYLRATKSMASQTVSKNFPTNISDDYSSIQSIEYMSSSEEQEALLSPNPFSTARRSKKYTSKKSYKDYLQSRPHTAENNKSGKGNITTANGNNSNNISSSASSDFPNSDNNNNSINGNRENLNGKEIGISKSTNGGGAAKFSLIMNDIHGIRQQKQQPCDDTHSLKINRMHGISLTSLNGNERKDMSPNRNNSDEGDDTGTRAVENGNQSAINTMLEIREHQHDTAVITRKYCDDGLEVKQKIVTRDDWYISDIEETETLGGKPSYSNCKGVSNSVLECVNQILLQQSMDEFIETQHEKRSSFASSDSKDSNSSAPPTRTSKRVHFSTKNSMVQITPLPRTPPSDHHSDDMLNSTYENQSTYSNEYEPIGSSRTYVDMDTKSLDNYKPTLPPKPNNLMKLQQISKQRQFVQDQIYKPKNSDYDLNESEPDYCSISEIQDNIKSVKIVTAEIHNDADDNEYSEIKEVPTPSPPSEVGEDSFEDVPKLPNVYSIIPGFEPPTTPTRKETTPVKCIGHDNYITKSPIKKKIISISSPSSILAEINHVKKPQPSPPKSAPPLIPIKAQQTIKIIDEKIQQEFDWYNLDAEYQSKTEVITTQIENIEEMYQFDDENLNDVMNGEESDVKVEYNLDFEFDQASSENGIEIETNNNNFTTVIKINECSSSNESTPPAPVMSKTTSKTSTSLIELAETPKLDLKKKLNYEKFLSESGMLSKPLMGRKKFYAGSFV